MVLFSHTAYLLPLGAPVRANLFAFFGFMGVELFFVLSGYLIGGILLRMFSTYGVSGKVVFHFWIRRWFRTLPGYYLALLLYLGLHYFSFGEALWKERMILPYLVFGQNWFTPHPSFFPIAWSLSVEEWFYILLPPLIGWGMIFLKNNQTRLLWFIGLMLFAYPLFRLGFGMMSPVDWNYDLRMRVPFRFDSLLIGVFTWLYLSLYPLSPRAGNKAAILGLLLLAACSIYFFAADPPANGMGANFSGSYYFTLVSLGVALLLPFLAAERKLPRTIFTNSIGFLSRISYSLYLTHVISIFIATTILQKWVGDHFSWLKWICSWMLSIVFAALLYTFYEKPMMDLRDKFSPPKP